MEVKMYYYKLNDKILISKSKYELPPISEETAAKENGTIYALTYMPIGKSKKKFCVTHPSLLFAESESINFLREPINFNNTFPEWLSCKIKNREVSSVNTAFSDWKEALCEDVPYKKSWNINVIGLGDVGSMVVTGLRLLGGSFVNVIGIYDMDENKVRRMEYEANQILDSESYDEYPSVKGIKYDDIFNCDMFVFCVSAGVPEIGKELTDVRMAQFEKNSKIIEGYAKLARKASFKGIFAVISDPVDLLCKSVFISSNKNDDGTMDFKGLCPDQIRGYGLGVMNARASYFAGQSTETMHYLKHGRAFGPHGEGLIIADSMENYNDEISMELTQKTVKANLEVRALGFKPYIAPALSSGSLSLISTIKGHWHYSSTFLGGIFFGARNRLTKAGTEVELLKMNDKLFLRIEATYNNLGMF